MAKYYAIINDKYIQKDTRTNQLEIYEERKDAERRKIKHDVIEVDVIRSNELKDEIFKTMKDVANSDDALEGGVWWIGKGMIHETMWERLYGIYLMVGGTEKEAAEEWPELF